MYLHINSDDLREQGYTASLNAARRLARLFLTNIIKRLNLDASKLDEIVEINAEAEWSFEFDGKFQYENAAKLQADLREEFSRRFNQKTQLVGNVIRVEKKCYRVVIVGNFGLFEAFEAEEDEFRKALKMLPPGVNAMVGTRAQLDSLKFIIRCPNKAVAEMLQARTLVLERKLQPEVVEWVRRLRANDESLKIIEPGSKLAPKLRCEDAQALAEALKVNSTLTRLGLRGCTGIGDAGCVALADALKVNSTLEDLSLSHCTNISIFFCVALADALKVNSTLRMLHLDKCTGIGNDGCVALADALKVNSTLGWLGLTHCTGIDNGGCVALADALKVNNTLESLHLSDCTGIGNDGCVALADALKVNSTL
jgi:hypothetical protein